MGLRCVFLLCWDKFSGCWVEPLVTGADPCEDVCDFFLELLHLLVGIAGSAIAGVAIGIDITRYADDKGWLWEGMGCGTGGSFVGRLI